MLAVQERELKRRFELEHDDRLRAERQQYQAELAGLSGELRAVRDAITGGPNDTAVSPAESGSCGSDRQRPSSADPAGSAWLAGHPHRLV